MPHPNRRRVLQACTCLLLSPAAFAAGPPNTQELLDAQRKALAVMAAYDGAWRGEATVLQPDGAMLKLTQTERVGPFLDGAVRLIEGRGHRADGSVTFNAFAVVSYSPQTGQYSMRSYAQGHAGDFPIELRPDGFIWSIPAGPAVIRYTSTVKDGTWIEVGERLAPGQPPLRTFEMTLRRIGPTDWPAAGAVRP